MADGIQEDLQWAGELPYILHSCSGWASAFVYRLVLPAAMLSHLCRCCIPHPSILVWLPLRTQPTLSGNFPVDQYEVEVSKDKIV